MRITKQLLENLVETINSESNLILYVVYRIDLAGFILTDSPDAPVKLQFELRHAPLSKNEMFLFLQGLLSGIRAQSSK